MSMPTSRAIRLVMLLLASLVASACNSAPVLNGSAPLATDNGGRYTTEVMLNGAGPYAFIVDTGAQASVLSGKTAAQLKLQSTGHAQVVGASGGATSWIGSVADYRSGVFARRNEPMVVVPSMAASSADGVLGMNAFVSGRIEFGFANRMLKAGPSASAPSGYVAQTGEVRQGTFFIVDAVVDGVHAKAMIDTGGRRTVGNPALQAALGLKPGDPRLLATESIDGATTQKTPATKAGFGMLAIGTAAFSKPTLVFADLPVFHSLGIDNGPALIVGVDEFSRLKAMAIDYPRAELQMLQ